MTENFNVPGYWKVLTLEDISEGKNAIVDGPFGSNLKTSDYISDKVNGVPVLTTKNLEGDYSDSKVRFISKEKFEELKRSQVNPGDILVAKIGSIGKTGIYPKNARTAIIPANLLKFTVSKHVNFNYVYLYLNSRGLQNRIKKISTATAQPAFNVTKFRKLRIPIPPLKEQHAIVSKIEELLSELDKGKQQLETAHQQLKIYRQAVLKWAFEGRLTNKNVKEGELPKGWRVDKIKNVCINIKVGIVVKPTNFYSKNNHGIRAFRSANVREFRVSDQDWVYFSEEANDLNRRTQIKADDVLLVRSGYPGTSCVVPKSYEGCNAIDILIATPDKNKILPDFLCSFNNSPLGKGHFVSKSRGVAQKHLNVGEYSNLSIAYPSIEEQHTINQELESKLSLCAKVEETIITSLAQAETLRQSILKKAFEGKLI